MLLMIIIIIIIYCGAGNFTPGVWIFGLVHSPIIKGDQSTTEHFTQLIWILLVDAWIHRKVLQCGPSRFVIPPVCSRQALYAMSAHFSIEKHNDHEKINLVLYDDTGSVWDVLFCYKVVWITDISVEC